MGFRILIILLMMLPCSLWTGTATANLLTMGILSPPGLEPDSLDPVSLMLRPPVVIADHEWNWVCSLCRRLPTQKNGDLVILKRRGKPESMATIWEIRQEVNWSDGKPVTGYDVRRTLTKLRKKGTIPAGIKVTVDPNQPRRFTVRFNKVRYDYARLMSYSLIPESAGNGSSLLSYGAWRVSQAEPDQWLLRRSDNEGHQGALRRLRIRLFDKKSGLLNALQAGRISYVAENEFTFPDAAWFRKVRRSSPASDLRILATPGSRLEYLSINMRNPMLASRAIRQAIYAGINRDRLLSTTLKNYGQKADGIFNRKDPFHRNDRVETSFLDRKKAADFLSDAGWRSGPGDIRKKNGKTLTLRLAFPEGPRRRKIAAVIRTDLQRIGISIVLTPFPEKIYFSKILPEIRYPDLALHSVSLAPGTIPWSLFHSTAIPDDANQHTGNNFAAWNSPVADRLLEEAIRRPEFADQSSLMGQLSSLLANELPVLPLFHWPSMALISSRVQRVQIPGHLFGSSLHMAGWNLRRQAGSARPFEKAAAPDDDLFLDFSPPSRDGKPTILGKSGGQPARH